MKIKRTFVTTDTHGEKEKLLSCLNQAKFDFEHDELIHLGDVCDRGPDSYGVVELLLSIKNLISIRGNHDDWMRYFIESSSHPAPSYFLETRASYIKNIFGNVSYPTFLPEFIPQRHKDFYNNQVNYYIDAQNRLFIHAGFNPAERLSEQDEIEFYWDRDLMKKAMSAKNSGVRLNDVNNFKQIFIGHTPTLSWKKRGEKINTPIYAAQVVICDTGACFGGKVSLIDITRDDHILYQA